MREKARHIWTNIQKRKGLYFFILWLLFFGLGLLFRLPHLLSKSSFFDGDEAIIGIMANDLLNGRAFPIYFYGQSYGLSMFEVWSSAFWIAILGKGLWALRIAGLTMFSLGTTFIYKGLENRGRSRVFSFLVAIAVLSFPTWIIWGMLVRGGYVTSFLSISLIFYLLSQDRISILLTVFLGVLMAISFEAHNLLLIPLLPLFLKEWMARQIKWYKLGLGLISAASFVGIFRLLDWNKIVWDTPTLLFDGELMRFKWEELQENILNIYSDFYVYSTNFEIPVWWSSLLIISLVLLFAIVVVILLRSTKTGKLFWVIWLFASLSIALLSFTLIGYNPRYLVSLFTGVLFLYIFYSNEVSKSIVLKGLGVISLIIFLAGLGAGSKIKREYYDTNVHCMNTFEAWHDSVVREEKKAVYIDESLLQWQWNYMYGDEIPAAPYWKEERTNQFIDAVERIHEDNIENVAIIGYWGHFSGLDSLEGYNSTRYHLEKKYFVQPIVKQEYIDIGFAKHTQ